MERIEILAVRGASLFERLALGIGFLSAVADRFGLWGPPRGTNVAWGTFSNVLAYAARVNPWAPAAAVPAIGWSVTAAEVALGITLLAGVHTRTVTFLSGLLLLGFAVGMTAGTGVKTAFDASVFTASAATFLLATRPAPHGPGSARS